VEINVPMETLDGLEMYSHAWILFEFHANTDLGTSTSSSRKTKIKPPRGGGIKVGQLATRSPHRPNALGLSLVRITKVDKDKKRLDIAAFDLVNGTPVYDVKPFVPWDIPGYPENHHTGDWRAPEWVQQQGDTMSSVEFSESATRDLDALVERGLLVPLYTAKNDGSQAARRTLEEILAQDPRATHKRGTLTADDEPTYNIIFGKIQVEFRVYQGGIVRVLNVRPAHFEDSAIVDGIPLVKL